MPEFPNSEPATPEKPEDNGKICECPAAGFCQRYQRRMSERAHAICRGDALTPAQQAAYRANWAAMAASRPAGGEGAALKIVRGAPAPKTPIHPAGPCVHFGEAVREETCRLCGRRGKIEAVHACAIWGLATRRPYSRTQPEAICRGCEQYTPPPAAEPAPSAMTPEEIARLNLPPGFPPPPADMTPLPAGRETFSSSEWRSLPPAHKDFYRALRRAKEAALAPPPPVPLPPGQSMPTDKTPFSSPDGKPMYLSKFGQGASAFIVLGGPSLNALDLSLLSRRGVWSIGVNNVSGHVKTNAWTFVDSPTKFCDSIWQDPSITKFVHRRYLARSVRTRLPDGTFATLKDGDGAPLLVRDFPAVIGIDRNADFDPSRWLAEPTLNWGNSKKSAARSQGKYPQVLNSMLLVVKLVYALGFRACYLLGCDFTMSAAQPYAFAQTKAQGGVNGNNGSYRKLNEMFGLLQPHFLAAGFHIFNCNATSGLTIFPHVDYSAAIAIATSRVEQRPNLAGWYNGHAGD